MAGIGIFVAILVAVSILALVGTVWYIIARIKSIAREGFGTDNLKEIMRQQEAALAEPKSVSGMTSVYLPKLQADFPELNWDEMQETAKQHLREYLENKGLTNIRFHKTALNDYIKKAGTCYAKIQTALQHDDKDGNTTQTRYNVTMSYVQDAEKTGFAKAYAITCPNCGAAVTSLGHKNCEYCGAVIKEVSRRVWELSSIEEV
ncbi:MAG: hypothetical protein J6Z46_11610 [Lachnospiraceae bacterium]|nr:hypothetical protein [Lachnospiraceae bacterium]MBP5250634.1 hypothetical protein [Lachnospiraceae bacterium]